MSPSVAPLLLAPEKAGASKVSALALAWGLCVGKGWWEQSRPQAQGWAVPGWGGPKPLSFAQASAA